MKNLISLFIGLLMLSLPIGVSLQLNLTYDKNGNLITGDGKYREYNEFNQLIRIRNGSNSNGTLLEEYIYHPTEERVLYKRVNLDQFNDPDEVVVYVNDNFVRKYYNLGGITRINDSYYAKDENGIAGEIVMNGLLNGTNVTQIRKLYYHNDHLGSTSVITNDSGGVVEETFYEPFGGIVAGGNASRFYYEGKDFSPLTSEYDFNFRKYNPDLLIFTKPDAMVSNVYDPQALNRYSFEKNNPYKYVDKDGKSPLLAIGVAGAVVGLFVYDYLVFTGQVEYSLKGQLGYAVGGAAGALIAAEIVAISGGTILSYSTGSVIGATYSNTVTNLATEQPASQGIVQVAIFSSILGPIGKFSSGNDFSRILGTLGAEELANQVALGSYYKYFSQTSYSNIGGSNYNINPAIQINLGQQTGGGWSSSRSSGCGVYMSCQSQPSTGSGGSYYGGGGGSSRNTEPRYNPEQRARGCGVYMSCEVRRR